MWEVLLEPEAELRGVVLAAAYLERKRAALGKQVKYLRGRASLAKKGDTVDVKLSVFSKGRRGMVATTTRTLSMTRAEVRSALAEAQTQLDGAALVASRAFPPSCALFGAGA